MKNCSELNEVIRVRSHLGSEEVRSGPWKPEFWRQPPLTNRDSVSGLCLWQWEPGKTQSQEGLQGLGLQGACPRPGSWGPRKCKRE